MPGKMFLSRGKCYEIGTQAFCTTPQEQAYFTKGSGMPNCFAKPVTTEVCQTAKQGGGTVQQVVIITPSPVSPIPPPPPPTLSETMAPVSPPEPDESLVSPFLPPLPPPGSNMTLPRLGGLSTKTLSNAGQIPCAGGKARSSVGDCSPRADF
ncbi:unnamed protein product [Allacma fusca]|uniref:Uncharacterized protein n=1 Tax=Allacma fusca TaxID=39272 RepID=A0A8J2KVM0_9HEXA|nr:unnamed protein product [Allacma fusca]